MIYPPTYDPLAVSQANRNSVYYRVYGGGWNPFANSIADVACPSARTALTNNGHYEGNTNASCSSGNRTLRTGNYRNYRSLPLEGVKMPTKLSIAKRVINDFLDTIYGVRIGVMVFNRVVTINSVSDSEGGRLQSSIKSLDTTTRSQLKTDINNITAETWDPPKPRRSMKQDYILKVDPAISTLELFTQVPSNSIVRETT